MFEKIMIKDVMVAKFKVEGVGVVTFEKFTDGNKVRIILDNKEIDGYYNFEIKDNHDRFEKSCLEALTTIFIDECE